MDFSRGVVAEVAEVGQTWAGAYITALQTDLEMMGAEDLSNRWNYLLILEILKNDTHIYIYTHTHMTRDRAGTSS